MSSSALPVRNARNASLATAFLPDFCNVRVVFAVVLLGELLAFVLILSPFSVAPGNFQQLAVVSLFVQWVGLLSVAVLCGLRRWLVRFNDVYATLFSVLPIALITVLVSEAAFQLFIPRLLLQGHVPLVWQFDVLEKGLGPAYPVDAPRTFMGHGEFLVRNLAISLIVSLLAMRYFYVQRQWQLRMESETDARIQALQSRIRPHFLFNSMNTIASLTRTDPKLAEQVTEDLADLFRVSLSDARVPVRLEHEIEIARQYLRIEQQRLGERLQVAVDVAGAPADALLPALTIQPLVENAVYHGIEPSESGGQVRLQAETHDGVVVLRIDNDLPSETSRFARSGHSMAQANVRERLRAFFGAATRFEARRDGASYRVELEFPYRRESPDGS